MVAIWVNSKSLEQQVSEDAVLAWRKDLALNTLELLERLTPHPFLKLIPQIVMFVLEGSIVEGLYYEIATTQCNPIKHSISSPPGSWSSIP